MKYLKTYQLFELRFEDFDEETETTPDYSEIDTTKIKNDFIEYFTEILSSNEDEDEDKEDLEKILKDLQVEEETYEDIAKDFSQYFSNTITNYLINIKQEIVNYILNKSPDLYMKHKKWFEEEGIKVPDFLKRADKTGLLDTKIK